MGMVAMLVMWLGPFEQIFVPTGGSTWNLIINGPVAFETIFETVKLWQSWVKVKVKRMTLTSFTHKFRPKLKTVHETLSSSIFHIWPCQKKDQGQLLVIIRKILVVLTYPMLHSKFQGHLSCSYREEDFKDFTIYRHGCHIAHVKWTVWTHFPSLHPCRLYI